MAGPGKQFVTIAQAAARVNLTPLQAEARLARLRRKYGTPPKLARRGDPTDWVHVTEIELLRVVPHAALPADRPRSLWSLSSSAPSTQQNRRPHQQPPPAKARSPRMCMACNKTKPGDQFPQKRFDVCAKCSPASRASVDLLDRALRGGSPGLGKHR